MMIKTSDKVWYAILGLGLFLGLGIIVMYSYIPADGASGDMESLTQEGYRVQWLIEERPGGLEVNDLIISAGGYPLKDLLQGKAGRTNWSQNNPVEYQVIRNGQILTLNILPEPLSIGAVFSRWVLQSFGLLAYFAMGIYIFSRQPNQLETRIFMLFCTALALQLLGDAYNIQFSTITQQWPFWLHQCYEFGTFHLAVSSICYWVFIFPAPHPLTKKYPHLTRILIFFVPVVILGIAFFSSSDMIVALQRVNLTSWGIAIFQICLTIGIGIRSTIVAHDPTIRAQMRWLLFFASLEVAVIFPGYALPLLLGIPPLFPHPVTNSLIALMPILVGFAFLRWGLFNIQIVINYTIVFGSISAVLTVLYLIAVRLSTVFVQHILRRQDDTLVVFIATLSIALLVFPLRQQAQRFFDRIFYRNSINYEKLLPAYILRLSTGMVPEQLNQLLTVEFPQEIQINQASLFVLDSTGQNYSPISKKSGLEKLSKNHPVIEYLQSIGEPLIRLQSAKTIPSNVMEYLNSNNIETTIPLIFRRKMVGIYNLGKKISGDAYNYNDTKLIRSLGQQAAIAVENSRLLQEKEKQTELIAGLHQAAVAISSSLEIEELLDILVSRLGKIMDVSSAYICDFDETTYQSTVLAEWINIAAADQTSDLGTTYDMRNYPAALKAMQNFEPLIITKGNLDIDVGNLENFKKHGGKAYLAIPFIVQNRLIGFMELWETRVERIFTDQDIRICQTLASDAATVMERVRLFQSERKQRRLAEAIQEAAAIINSSLELDVVLDFIFEQVAKVIKGDTFNIMLIEGEIAQIIRGHGYTGDKAFKTVQEYRIKIEEFPTLNQMAKTGKSLVIPDTSKDPLWTYKDDWQKPNSFIGAPILMSGKTIGFLNVNGNRPFQFSEDDAIWLETFANTVAAALDRARLFEAERDQRLLAEALQKSAYVISSSLDLDDVFDHILDQIRTVIPSDTTINIMMIEENTATMVRWQGYDDLENQNSLPGFSMSVDEYVTFKKMTISQRALLIPDTALSTFWKVRPGWEWQRSYLGAPIIIEGKIAGFINIEGTQPNMFDIDDANHLEVFAYHAATAIQNARLFKQIKESLAEKEILLKEIHHRVKNNLQIINSLLSLHSSRTDDSQLTSIFRESQNRVHSMALVHDKLYRSENIARINFGEYIQDLVQYLHGAYRTQNHHVKLIFQIENISLDIDAAIPCGLVLNELISNAFKHSFPVSEGSMPEDGDFYIKVDLHLEDEGLICLQVANNGVLAPKDLDLQTPRSLGLQLVKTLTNQLEGTIKFEITDETIFTIRFPKFGQEIKA